MRENTLKTAWKSGQETVGLWLSSADPVLVESLGQVGYDYLCLDIQHGLVDYRHAVPTLQALNGSPAIPLARAPWNEPGIIGKLLDAGMMGVIVPMVNTVAEARAAVSACRYAPDGARSYGPARAAPVLGPDYYPNANREVACIPMIETAEAIENLDDIVKVEGIDAIYVGPADLSISLGLPPGSDNDASSFQDAIAHVVSACRANGIAPGIHSIPALVPTRLSQGFQMVTATNDIGATVAGAKAHRAIALGERDEGQNSMY